MDQFLQKHKPLQLGQFEIDNMNSSISTKETALIIFKFKKKQQNLRFPVGSPANSIKYLKKYQHQFYAVSSRIQEWIRVLQRNRTQRVWVCLSVCVYVCIWGGIYSKKLDHVIEEDGKSKICRICWHSGDPGRVKVALKVQRQSTS